MRWLRRVWTLCYDHIETCSQAEGGEREGEEETEKIVSATHKAIHQVQLNCR